MGVGLGGERAQKAFLKFPHEPHFCITMVTDWSLKQYHCFLPVSALMQERGGGIVNGHPCQRSHLM